MTSTTQSQTSGATTATATTSPPVESTPGICPKDFFKCGPKFCCGRGQSCCHEGCCLAGYNCCTGGCCPPEMICCPGGCCASGTVSTNTPTSPSSPQKPSVTLTPTETSGSSNPVDDGSSGLSGGATAGIVVGCVAVVAIVLLGLFFIYRRRKKRSAAQPKEDTSEDAMKTDPTTGKQDPNPQELHSEAKDYRDPNRGEVVEADTARPVYELDARETLQPVEVEAPTTDNSATNTK